MPVFNDVLEIYFQSLIEKNYTPMEAFDPFAPRLIERLRWHKLIALAVTLSRKNSCPPQGHLDRALQEFASSLTISEEFYYHKTLELYRCFSEAGVPFYPLKGPFWASIIYPDPGWRHIGDLDLIILPGAAERVFDILSALDLFPITEPHTNRLNMAATLARRGQLAFMTKRSREFIVEIHQVLVSAPRYRKSYNIRMDPFWESDRKHAWREIAFTVPPLEVWFVYLILHGACQHQFMRLLSVVDIIHFLDVYREDLDWDKVVLIAMDWKVEKALYHSLKFINAFTANACDLPSPLLRKTHWFVRLQASFLNKKTVLLGTRSRGRYRRKLFRAAIT